jgi:nucleoside-diphosphate-sugar epimerase
MITGGTGSLGSCLTRKLLDQGHNNIVLFDTWPNYKRINDFLRKVTVVSGDITDWTDIASTMEKYHISDVFHLAAILSSEAREKPLRALKINAEGTVNILEACRIFGIKKVIFVSSISTYGPGLPEPVNEAHRQQPTNIYGITKLFCELWGSHYYSQYNIDFRAVRFPRIVNAGRAGTGVAVFPSRMIENAALGKAYEVEVTEGYRVPIIYIKDAVNILLSLYKVKRVNIRVYNINGLIPTAREILQIIQKYIPDAPIKFSSKPITPHLTIPFLYDDERAREELGWRVGYSLEKMVEDFIHEVHCGRESRKN